jgi:hypothetical protein
MEVRRHVGARTETRTIGHFGHGPPRRKHFLPRLRGRRHGGQDSTRCGIWPTDSMAVELPISGVFLCCSSSFHQVLRQACHPVCRIQMARRCWLPPCSVPRACLPGGNDPGLLACAAFLACWRCRYSFTVIDIPMITDYTMLWWVV